jgi:hypothetical protein
MASREHAGMKDVWQNRQNYPRSRNLKTKSKLPLVTSDAHSSRLAYRYQFTLIITDIFDKKNVFIQDN